MTTARALFFCASLAVVASCDQCEQAVLTRGNLDRVADVVVVNTVDGSSVAIAANPELQVLRLIDLTAGRFLEAPNRFSPLSIPTGADTRQLALAVAVDSGGVDVTRLYALDGSDDVVQVIRLPDNSSHPAYVELTQIPVGPLPVDVAAVRKGEATTVAVARVTDTGSVVEFYDVTSETLLATVDLGVGHASAIVADPLGESVVVADAGSGFVHVVHVVHAGDDDVAAPDVRHLDVGGPTAALAAGVVDVGDGLAPVVVALRSDTPAIMAVRLFRPTFREERYAVVGGTALPSLPVEAYVPDARPSGAPATVCCRGLSDEAIALGEATDAFASVWLANGDMLHVALAATTLDGVDLAPGRTLVRLIDDDKAGPSAPEGIDLNGTEALWAPAEGGEARRPTLTLDTVDNFGSPPFFPIVAAGTSLLLTWEGDIPRLKNLSGNTWNGATRTFTANRDLATRGARVGDVARFLQLDPGNGTCDPDTVLRGVIVAVDAADITVAAGAEFDDATADACLGAAIDTVRVTIEAAGAFVVDNNGVFVARLADSGDEAEVVLDGVRLSFVASSAGLPLHGSKLAVPLDAHITTMGMDLADAPRQTGGGLGVAAFVPTGIAGGTLTIPDAASEVDGAVVDARRMVFSSGSVDGNTGLPLLFTCDEGETVEGRVESFR